ncbi:MAG: hypothetical protein PHT40_04655 [Patescibacteria group bacterium]|nr:hypothetical protein [Patescibacteria group bacterium]
MKKITTLQTLFVVFITLLFALIIITPHLFGNPVLISKNIVIEEEYAESIIIVLLLAVSYAAYYFYKKELIRKTKEIEKLEEGKKNLGGQLTDAFKYIGAVNVQIEQIRSVFSSVKKYPESKKDFKNILNFLAERVLGIVSADWVVLRIIDLTEQKTLSECVQARGETVLLKHEISNRALVNGEPIDSYSVVASNQKSLSVKVFCVLPIAKITADQEVLIKAIVNQLDMLFVIFTSAYYKDKNGQ